MAKEHLQAETPKAKAFSLALFNPSETQWHHQDFKSSGFQFPCGTQGGREAGPSAKAQRVGLPAACSPRPACALRMSCPDVLHCRGLACQDPSLMAGQHQQALTGSKARGGHGPFPSHSSLSPAFPFPSPVCGKPACSGDAVPRYQNGQHPPTASYVAMGVSLPQGLPPHHLCPVL